MTRSSSSATLCLALVLAGAVAAPALAATATGATRRVSVTDAGRQSPTGGNRPAVSAGGRYVAFSSGARLTAADTDDEFDVYVRDRVAGRTFLASVGDVGAGAERAGVSGDGSRVLYTANDDIWLRDRATSTTTLVSATAPGEPEDAYHSYSSISADGRYVAYDSRAAAQAGRIYLRDLTTGGVTQIDRRPGGGQSVGGALHPQVSEDGSAVSFRSTADDLVAGDTNGLADVFVWRRSTGALERVSVTGTGAQANGSSGGGDQVGHAPSNGGRYVAFVSLASNLVAGDTAASPDVFLRDTLTGTTVRVSQAADGSPADARSTEAGISADGRLVVFISGAGNISPGDSRHVRQVHVWDRTTATSVLGSVSGGGIAGNADSYAPRISADGSTLVYSSLANSLVGRDTNRVADVFATPLAP